MPDYTPRTTQRLNKLRNSDCEAYAQLVYGPSFQLSERAMSEQLDNYEQDHKVKLS